MAKIALMLADGFEEIEGLTVVDICRRCKIDISTVSIKEERVVVSSHKIPIAADAVLDKVNLMDFDMLVLPGGLPGTTNLEACAPLMEALDAFYADSNKYLAAICAAPSIFGHRGYLKGRKATSHPSFESHLEGANVKGNAVEVDGHIITAQGMGASIAFALEIARVFAGRDATDDVAAAICYRG